MRTVLATHVYLDCEVPGYRGEDGRCRRFDRFLERWGDTYPIVAIDNGSDFTKPHDITWSDKNVWLWNCQPHYERGAGNDYPSVWRIYWQLKELFKQYDRIFFISTDTYICSQRMMDYLESLTTGWTGFWCHNHPESQIQVITPCREFMKFFYGPCDPYKYNGAMEEKTLPFTHIERGFTGDRYGEFLQPPGRLPLMDYYCQVPDALDWDDSQFPVIRRVDGEVKVLERVTA